MSSLSGNGNTVSLIKCWREPEPGWACRQIVDELNKLKEQYGLKPNEVSGDADGMGIAFCSMLSEHGWNINRFRGGTHECKDNVSYYNVISECWLNGIRLIRNGVINLPNDNELKLQLISRKQKIMTNGKLALESKEDMKARGIPSPDRADAVLMAISDPVTTSGELSFMKTLSIPAKEYSFF